MQSSDFENDIKAIALQKFAPYTATTATTTTTAPRIALTKTTFLTPIQKSQSQTQQQKPLYTTLTAKQTTPTGSVTSTNLGKVVIKDFKGIIKPILAKTATATTAATKTTATPAIASPLATTTTTSSKISGVVEGEAVGNLNVAIVAAKRPQLTIVATKSAALVDATSLGVTAVTATSTATIASPTTIATTTNVIFLIYIKIICWFCLGCSLKRLIFKRKIIV